MGRGSCLEITHAASLKDCLGKSKEAKITSHPSSYVYLPDPSWKRLVQKEEVGKT